MINGELIDLQAGEYQARVATCGAMLVHLRRHGRDLVIPFDAERALPGGWQGKTLVPWPNRIKGAAYTYAGTTFPVPCNEPATGSALHGLVGWSDFQVTRLLNADGADLDAEDSQTGESVIPAGVVLSLLMPASYAYPWTLQVEVTYALDAQAGLSYTVTTTNLGASLDPADGEPGAPQSGGVLAPAPYGVSWHPYLTRSVSLDECVLEVPAATVLETDPATMAPTGRREVAGSELDWRGGRLVGGTHSDHAYTDLPDGPWQVRLRGGEGNRAVVMAASVPWVQVFSAENLRRLGAAVEPMTCPPNAFTSGEDLITPDLGQSHAVTFHLYEED